MRIKITWPKGQAHARLEDTPTARKVMAALPIRSRASTWGEEVYFDTGIDADLEPDARQVVDPGTVCFWTDGNSLALPYGPTPVSRGSECRLVSEVNILGALEGDARVLATVRSGDPIAVEAAE
ncbi:MAG: cyclophilin-like fold protein [Gemmatimonadota bacterium]